MESAECGFASFASNPRGRVRPPASGVCRAAGTIVAKDPSPVARLPALPPMKPLRRHFFLPLAGALLLLGACSSSPMLPLDAQRAVYETWPVDIQEAVVRQPVIPGMTPAMVEVALGKLAEVQSRVGQDGPEEVWNDRNSSNALPGLPRNTGLSVGVGGVSNSGISDGVVGGGVGVSTSTSGRRGGSRAHRCGRSGNRFPQRHRAARLRVTRASPAPTAAPSMVRSAGVASSQCANLRRNEKIPNSRREPVARPAESRIR